MDFYDAANIAGYKTIGKQVMRDRKARVVITHIVERSGEPILHACACGNEEFCYFDDGILIHLADTRVHNEVSRLAVRQKRYRCSGCDKLQTDDISDVASPYRVQQRVSRRRFTRRAIDQMLSEFAKNSFVDIAKEFGVGESAARRVILEACKDRMPELKTPRFLGIDEVYLKLKRDAPGPEREKTPGQTGSRFGRLKKHKRLVLVDLDSTEIISVHADSDDKTIRKALSPFVGDLALYGVAMDGAESYQKIVSDLLPHARIVYDRFHVTNYIQSDLNKILLAEWENLNPKSTIDKHLLSCLRTDPRVLSHKEQTKVQGHLRGFPRSAAAYAAAIALRRFFDERISSSEARAVFDAWKAKMTKCCGDDSSQFNNGIVKLIETRKTDIFAYFDLRITNAATEAGNRTIRDALRVCKTAVSYETLQAKIIARRLHAQHAERMHCNMCGQKFDRTSLIYTDRMIFEDIRILPAPDQRYALCSTCNDQVAVAENCYPIWVSPAEDSPEEIRALQKDALNPKQQSLLTRLTERQNSVPGFPHIRYLNEIDEAEDQMVRDPATLDSVARDEHGDDYEEQLARDRAATANALLDNLWPSDQVILGPPEAPAREVDMFGNPIDSKKPKSRRKRERQTVYASVASIA